MGEDIRFWCARCGQPIVADCNAVGFRADCPNCRLPLIIPPPAHRDECENYEFRPPEGLRDGEDARASLQAEVQLAYVREQLEATAETCSKLGVCLARKQRESRFFLLERLSLANELGLVRRLLEESRGELIQKERSNERMANPQGAWGLLRGEDPKPDRAFGPPLLESHSAQYSMVGLCAEANWGDSVSAAAAGGVDSPGEEDVASQGEAGSGRCAEPEPRNGAPLPNAGSTDIHTLRQDNVTLRGMIDRQNQELRDCYRELRRYRRAQIGLRVLYGLVVLVGLALFWESWLFLMEL